MKTQLQHFYTEQARLASLNEFVMDSLREKTISPSELLKLAKRKPSKYGVYKKLANKLLSKNH